jgi:hypothetical protein
MCSLPMRVVHVPCLHVPEVSRSSFPITHDPTILSIHPFPPYVSSLFFHVVKLSTNFRQCLENVQEVCKDGSPQAPPRWQAPSL